MQGRIENNIRIKRLIENNLRTMPPYVKEWYINLIASGKEMSSCNDYIRKIRKFLLYINEDIIKIVPEDITMDKTETYFISIQTKINSNGKQDVTSDSYRQTIWCALNSFLGFLYNRKYIEENYMKYICKPKNKDLQRINENRVLLTKEDFNEILKCVQNGVGSHKAKEYQKNMNLFRRELLVIDKGNKRHVYYLTDDVIKYLKLWLLQRKDILKKEHNDALFVSENKTRLSSNAIYKLVEKYCKEALDEKISPHKLRSGFCSILYNETKDAEFVRRAVGHSNISTTQRYIVTDNSEKEKAANLINCLLKV